MERVIEKLKTNDPTKQVIANHLLGICKKEPAFIDKILNPNKTLDDALTYIAQRAREKAKNKRVLAVADEEVFGWVVHYFDDMDLEVKGTAKAEVVHSSVAKKKDKKDNPVYQSLKKTIKEEKDKACAEQLSLFELGL